MVFQYRNHHADTHLTIVASGVERLHRTSLPSREGSRIIRYLTIQLKDEEIGLGSIDILNSY